MNITIEQLERLGELADQANNLAAASELPLPAHIHIEATRNGLWSICETLRNLYIDISGDDPWADEPK